MGSFYLTSFSFISSPNPFFNLRVWRWNRMDIISTIKHFFHEFITFKYRKSYLWIINLGYILMSHISYISYQCSGLFGKEERTSMIYAMSYISLLGSVVWGHHMYTVG